jgi:hypothetical protein
LIKAFLKVLFLLFRVGLAAKLGELAMALLDAQEEDQQQSHSGDCADEEMEDETRSSSRLGFQVELATNLRQVHFRYFPVSFDRNGEISIAMGEKNCR